jgi:hypothetical protein
MVVMLCTILLVKKRFIFPSKKLTDIVNSRKTHLTVIDLFIKLVKTDSPNFT